VNRRRKRKIRRLSLKRITKLFLTSFLYIWVFKITGEKKVENEVANKFDGDLNLIEE